MEVMKNHLEDHVSHQGVLIPTKLLDSAIFQSCANLAMATGDNDYPLYLPGSATLIKYRERYFMVCTRHQLDQSVEGQFDNVTLMISSHGKETLCATPSSAKWTNRSLHETDYHEIVAFDFSEACNAFPAVKNRFFDIVAQHPDFCVDDVVAVTAYGFPSRLIDYNDVEKRINFGRLRVPCRFSGRLDVDPAVHAIQPLEPMTNDPDGMSGGPVFFVLLDGSVAKLHLLGVTVTGSEKALRIVKAGAVLRILEQFF